MGERYVARKCSPLSREWTSQQMAEKGRLQHEQDHADRLYNLKACELDQRAVELSLAEAETRRAINLATKDYNLALVRNTCMYVHCMYVCMHVCMYHSQV